ncbi:hypothetical protein TU84_09055 [Pseudomonas helleri]|nr:hypothetical protein TU84_09055 [Pseudomonas helleri]
MVIALSFYTVTGIIYSEDLLAILHFLPSAGRSSMLCRLRLLEGKALLAAAVVKCETARSQTEHAALTFYKSKRMFQTDVLMFCQAE